MSTKSPNIPPATSVSRFMRLPEVVAAIGVPRSTIYLWISQGRFIKPRKLGARAVGWPAGEVEEWMATRRQAA